MNKQYFRTRATGRILAAALALLFAFSALLFTACSGDKNIPSATANPVNSSRPQSNDASKDTGKDNKNNTAFEHSWPQLGDQLLLTIAYNDGKEVPFTAKALDNMKHIKIAVNDPNSGKDRNGSDVVYEGISFTNIFSALGLPVTGFTVLRLVDRAGNTIELTPEIGSFNFPDSVFAVKYEGNILDENSLCCFVKADETGKGVEVYPGICRIELTY